MTAPGSDVVAWRAAKDEGLASPHGFLAVTSLRWLDEEPARFDDAPGAWSSGPGGVVVDLGPGESLLLEDDTRITGRHVFATLAERDGVQVRAGDDSGVVVEVARRGGRDVVRPRDPRSPRRVDFAGTPAYPQDDVFVVEARWAPYAEPVPTTVGSVVEGLVHVYDAVGELAFSLGGEEHTLVAFPGREPGALHVLFTDTTAGTTTDARVRSLAVPAPDASGRVVLDFNRASNLPAAYTPHATCPLPPATNRLPVAVEAGDRVPA